MTKTINSAFDYTSDEFDSFCKEAVAKRNYEPITDYVTRFDQTTGKVLMIYSDGHIEFEE